MEKMLQLLGYLAVGSFLHVYMKKAKPRPKWRVQEAPQRWTLKGVFRFFSIFLDQLFLCADMFKEWVTKKAKTPDLSMMVRDF